MKLDHVFVILAPSPVDAGAEEVVAAYVDESDARASLRAQPGARMERCPLAPSTSAGIHRNREEGAREVEECLEDLHRTATRHNVTTCSVSVNPFHGAARVNFPTWSTIQASGDNVEARLLDGTEAQRTEASVDLLMRLAQGMAMQTQGIVRLAQDIDRRRGGGPPLIVVPGLPPGMRRRP